MAEQSLYIPKSAMAIVAHPDDIEFSCVGTLLWADRAHKFPAFCTSGMWVLLSKA